MIPPFGKTSNKHLHPKIPRVRRLRSVVAVLTITLACGISPAAAEETFVDYSWISPPADFVTLRGQREALRIPPLIVEACKTPTATDYGENYFYPLLARVELLRTIERPTGASAIRDALTRPNARQIYDPGNVYANCLDHLAPGWSAPTGISPNTMEGWRSVADKIRSIPKLTHTPGTDDVPLCRAKHEGDWDISMALMTRVWLRAREALARLGKLDLRVLEEHVARAAWLQGSIQISDFAPCAIGATLSMTPAGPALPETENHKLLIEATRFLHNESLPMIPQDEVNRAGTSRDGKRVPLYDRNTNPDNGSNGVGQTLKAWMATWVNRDFLEYNARPYGRFQMLGLLNLYDLAKDDSTRQAAQATLDFIAAKIAAESMNGLRTAPFRRKVGYASELLFDGDNVNPMFQVWIGNVAPLALVRGIPEGKTQEMVLAASSDYQPPDVLVDVMLNPAHHRYFQQFNGQYQLERAFGARDFTIAGGGTETGCPYPNPFQRPLGPRCPGSGNDGGTVEPIVLLPRRARVASSFHQPTVQSVIHTGPLGTNITHLGPASLSCIGRGIACGPSFNFGGDRPSARPDCSVDFTDVTGDHIQAWRFDRECMSRSPLLVGLGRQLSSGPCFFVYTRQIPADSRTFIRLEERRFAEEQLVRPALAYLITHECDPGARASTKNNAFKSFVNFLTTGPGAPTRPASFEELEPSCAEHYYCETAVDVLVPQLSGRIEPGERVTFAALLSGGSYALRGSDYERGLFDYSQGGTSAIGTLANIEPVPKGGPLDPNSKIFTITNEAAGERVRELDRGGIVYDTSVQPRNFSWTSTLYANGVVSGRITSAEHGDLIRSIRVDVDDATVYGQGCVLPDGRTLCYTRDCFIPPCRDDRPQTHHWQTVYSATFPVNGTALAYNQPLEFSGQALGELFPFSESRISAGRTIGRLAPLPLDDTHNYWLRACITWHRFFTSEEYRMGFARLSPDAHNSCDTATTKPSCISIICRAGGRLAPP